MPRIRSGLGRCAAPLSSQLAAEAYARRHNSAACRKSVAEIRKRAQRRQYDEVDLGGVQRDVGDEPSLDEQAEGLDGDRERPRRRGGQRAGVSGRQHVDPVGPQSDRL
jgi:hypothetical protein